MTKIILTILLALSALNSEAKLVQILHTNDLHSFFQGMRNGKGGYAQLKVVIDQLKADAESKGIQTIFVDGGDFGEGASFYFSNKGNDSLKALDLLGVDVTVLGNHDFITGGEDLSRQIKESGLQAKLLSANLKGKELLKLKNIQDYADFNIDGFKIRFFGLTTSEIHYQYPLAPKGFLSNSHNAGIREAKAAAKAGADLVIALTHTGLAKDKRLASKSKTIDLIIGGHDHYRFPKPIMVPNKNKKEVPIFQTGAHGMSIGALLIDIKGKREYEIVDYRLHDIDQSMPADEEILSFVEQAYINREQYFNRSWTEVIGFSEITLTGSVDGKINNPRSCWSTHVARLTREKAKADIGLQVDIFQGEEIPAGPIRFGDIIDNFPHFQTWGDKGWSITKAKVSGFVLKQIVKYLNAGDEPYAATLDGIYYFDEILNREIPFNPNLHKVKDALINGNKIRNLKHYTIALPSEITKAVGAISPLVRDLILRGNKTVEDSEFWPLFEEYISKNSPIKCLDY